MLTLFGERFAPLGKVAPPGEIAEVAAVGVSLALERDGPISRKPVVQLHEAPKPFKKINDVEGQEEQFAHLCRVDAFVIDHRGVDPSRVAHKQQAEEIDAKAFRHDPRPDDHRLFIGHGKGLTGARYRRDRCRS